MVHNEVVEVTKSPHDKKQYKYYQLLNGMRVLLIHDPLIVLGQQHMQESDDMEVEEMDESDGSEADSEDEEQGIKKAAAAMAVGVGSFCDPPSLQGLSHYLEHMLFMGSERYPDENEYDSFLAKHGGYSNAFTELESTNFHFEVNPDFLEDALSRFSGFFNKPLLKIEALEREVQAIDNEFCEVVQDDDARLGQLMQHTAVGSHVFTQFHWGNKLSLWDAAQAQSIDVRQKLLEYYSQYYCASQMCLTVLGGQSICELQQYVTESFGEVRNQNKQRPEFSQSGMPYQGQKLYLLPSIQDGHHLHMTFQLPSLFKEYRSKPEQYISHLLGHEGPGSLLSLLKQRGLATTIEVGVDSEGIGRTSCCWLFGIQIELTVKGLHEPPGLGLAVVHYVFQYINMLKSVGPQEWVWKEIKEVSAMRWKYQEEQDAQNTVTCLASSLFDYEPQHVLIGDYLHDHWNPQKVTSLLQLMSPLTNGWRIDLQSKEFDTLSCHALVVEQGQRSKEPWFGFEYVECPLNMQMLEMWENSLPQTDNLTLPPRNQYIPNDFSLLCDNLDNLNPPPFPAPPKLLSDQPGLRVWYKLDETFSIPRAYFYIRICSTQFYDSPKHAAMCHLTIKVLMDQLTEENYMAQMSGLQFDVNFEDASGMEFRFEGFSQHLPKLVLQVFQHMQHFVIDFNTFASTKEMLILSYKNRNMEVSEQANYLRLHTLFKRRWRVESILEQLVALDARDVEQFMQMLLKGESVFTECLMHGNIDQNTTLQLVNSIRLCGILDTAACPTDPVVSLPCDSRSVYGCAAKNKNAKTSVCETYFQGPVDTTYNRACVDMLEQLIQEDAFDNLRTKQQLGYSVYTHMCNTNGVLGFCIGIESGHHPPTYLEERIDAFLMQTRARIKKMADGEFNEEREALIQQRLQPSSNLRSESRKHWAKIFSKRYDFNGRCAEVEELKKLKIKDVLKWFKEFIVEGSNKKQLSIHVHGQPHISLIQKGNGKIGDTLVQDIEKLKSKLGIMPVQFGNVLQ